MMMMGIGIINVIVVMMVVVVAEAGVTIIATTCGCDRGMRVAAMMVVGAVIVEMVVLVVYGHGSDMQFTITTPLALSSPSPS